MTVKLVVIVGVLVPKVVQGPVADGPDCHWYITFDPITIFVSDNVNGVPVQIVELLVTVAPGFGIPEQAMKGGVNRYILPLPGHTEFASFAVTVEAVCVEVVMEIKLAGVATAPLIPTVAEVPFVELPYLNSITFVVS